MAKKLTTEDELEALRAKIAALEGELAEARDVNKEAAQRASYFGGVNEEKPTGRKVKVRRCKNPWVKIADEMVWEEVEVDTYLFTIDMPPVGGVHIVINGEEFQHGQTYEMTLDRLRAMKEFVYRLRAHEAAIHGEDEDKWRPRISKEMNLRTGSIRNLPPNWMPGAR